MGYAVTEMTTFTYHSHAKQLPIHAVYYLKSKFDFRKLKFITPAYSIVKEMVDNWYIGILGSDY